MSEDVSFLIEQLHSGQVVPYLGPGALRGVTDKKSGQQIPAESDSLILAMTGGTPMSPRLMYEFPRAAMHLENKKGRSFIERFLTGIYGNSDTSPSPLHNWIAGQRLPYVIDCNRDTLLQKLYSDRAHTLIVGCSRIIGTHYRYEIWQWDGSQYQSVNLADVNQSLPVLFKPLGTPLPKPTYVASDADFVDYITELMGGFAVPAWIKQQRRGKQYLLLGQRLNRDTDRMVLSDLIQDAAPVAGWALIPDANDKEKRFCERRHIDVLDADWTALLAVDALTTA